MPQIHKNYLAEIDSSDEDESHQVGNTTENNIGFELLNIGPNPNQDDQDEDQNDESEGCQPNSSNPEITEFNLNHFDEPSGSDFNPQHRHSFGQRETRARGSRGRGISQRGRGISQRGRGMSQRGGSNSHRGGSASRPGGSASHRRGSNSQRGENSDANEQQEQNIKKLEVRMPTGETVKITVPSSICDCKTSSETELIPLRSEGREFAIVTKQMRQTIKNHGSRRFSGYNIVEIYKVKNCCLWTRYRNGQVEVAKDVAKEMKKSFVNQKMLFHGSHAIDDILDNGFDERRCKQDGYFGAGIYFSKHSSKANRYVFGKKTACPTHKDNGCVKCIRQMLLCRVSLGRVAKKTAPEKLAHPPSGHNSVVGIPSPTGLKYPKYVIYRGEQAYPEYLIKYKIVK